jgi:hypothetical protein
MNFKLKGIHSRPLETADMATLVILLNATESLKKLFVLEGK